jgi:hypothetical protein
MHTQRTGLSACACMHTSAQRTLWVARRGVGCRCASKKCIHNKNSRRSTMSTVGSAALQMKGACSDSEFRLLCRTASFSAFV